MSPRRYEMANRSAAVQATRQRIVEAAVGLHARKGAMLTTWDDIAADAGVSRATVYHHFPSLEELVPACAQVAFDLIDVPTPQEASARFAKLRTPRARVAQFIRESCRCYVAGAPWLRAAWRERDLVPSMGAAVHRFQSALRVLLDASLEGTNLDRERRAVLASLLDFPFWDALDTAGVPREQIASEITRLAEIVIRSGG